MKKITQSAIFIGSNLLASIIVVILITYDIGNEERAAFFLFQAVFYPLTTLLSQTKILIMFKGHDFGKLDLLSDLFVFLLACLILYALGGEKYFDTSDILLYAASVPLTYRTATKLAEIQQSSSLWFITAIPIVVACARVLSIFNPTLDKESEIFLASSLTGFALTFFYKNAPKSKENTQAQSSNFVFILIFFIIASVTFQWDRLVLSYFESNEVMIAMGVCMLWVLSPVSAIFATVYRADAKSIFKNKSTKEKRTTYIKNSSIFVLGVCLYSLVISLTWVPINKLAFPYFYSPLYFPLILLAAISLDRLANLALFISDKDSLYLVFSLIKLLCVFVSALILFFNVEQITLLEILLIYFLASFAYYLISLGIVVKSQHT